MSIMGIDFGTTNSALALLENSSTRVVKINNRESSERTLRSVLFFDEERNINVGQQAIDQYISYQGIYGRFLQSLKAFLPNPSFTETTIFGKKFEIEDLIALILAEIKQIGEMSTGGQVERAVLGRPVSFSENPEYDALAEKRLRTAALRAGFKDIDFEYEPVAATLAYLDQLEAAQEQTVLMGDFGGGTSDFTVMKLRKDMPMLQDEKKRRVLSVGGVYIGGDTFDARIMYEKVSKYFGRGVKYRGMTGQTLPIPNHLIHTLSQWHMIPFLRARSTLQSIREVRRTADKPELVTNLENLILENKGFLIFQAIERAKKELSSEVEARINYHDRNLLIDEGMARDEFEAFITSDIEKISSCVSSVVSCAGVNPEQIDRILLTGGSSFVPAVRRIFENMFSAKKITHLDAFTSVAHGLALSASLG